MTKLDVLLESDAEDGYRVGVSAWVGFIILDTRGRLDSDEERVEIALSPSEEEHLRNILNERALEAIK